MDSADGALDPIRVVLADDHALVRGGLRRILEAEDDVTIVAEAGDADEAIELAGQLHPRIVLLDVTMPGTPSLDAIPSLLEAAPGCSVVMLTMHDDYGYAREALAAGASGYVLKDAAERQLVDAVRAVVAGRGYLDPSLGARAIAAPPPAARAASSGDLEIGGVFAGHRVDGVAGRGGMGIVYRATDLMLGRRVALKLMAPGLAADPTFRARFLSECRLAASIDHPHAVNVFHAGEHSGALYVTMRYVDGTDLRAILREQRQLDPERAVRFVGDVAGALDEAHRRGLVHRDVKPGNVLVAWRDEDDEEAYLADFGLTKERAVASDLTGTGLAIGTADYIAPEQAQGRDLDGRADTYALACVLYQCLAGAVPFERDSDLDKAWAHVHEPPPDLTVVRPDLPSELGHVLARAMAKDPGERPPTSGQFARAASSAITG
jgi:serine/threonine-protein kinase